MRQEKVLRVKSFAPALAVQTDLDLEKCEKIIDIMFDSIMWAMSRGYSVHIDGFGTFKPRFFKEKEWRNGIPNIDGSNICRSEAHIKISFRAHRKMNRFVEERLENPKKKKDKSPSEDVDS